VVVTGDLTSVSALSASNAWAVGRMQAGSGWAALAEHWDGTKWTASTVPAPSGSGDVYLNGVTAISASNVWAVGYSVKASDQAGHTLTEHWNGHTWAVVPSPSPKVSNNSVLLSVSAVSASNVWAAGYYDDTTGTAIALIEHWNGTSWRRVTAAAPTSGYAVQLESVSARSANNVWIAGDYLENGAELTLIEHWNGSAWAVVTSPNGAGSPDSELHGITAVSGTDAWATGFYFAGSTYVSLVEHWNGHAWKIVTSPNPSGSTDTYLYGVSADTASDAWSVGYYYEPNVGYKTLTEHWNGHAWAVVASPNPAGITSNYLYAVSAVSSQAAVATGNDFGTADQALAERWTGTKWTIQVLG
jgi:erythromycin esterase-like protein